jgi:hypothetical protein
MTQSGKSGQTTTAKPISGDFSDDHCGIAVKPPN